jgi:hypothetical protein
LIAQKPTCGQPYFGHEHGRAVIGVIPDGGGGEQAVFRYMADVVAHDVPNVDACVLRIKSRLRTDVDDKAGIAALAQIEKAIPIDEMPNECLKSLKMKNTFELEEHVRLTGYSQFGGGGISEVRWRIYRSMDVVYGHVRSHFKQPFHVDHIESIASDEDTRSFSPQEEIVVKCITISGQSGAPFINTEGKVLGILSRSDSVEKERCYVVPATEIKASMPGNFSSQKLVYY